MAERMSGNGRSGGVVGRVVVTAALTTLIGLLVGYAASNWVFGAGASDVRQLNERMAQAKATCAEHETRLQALERMFARLDERQGQASKQLDRIEQKLDSLTERR